jgi:hypothetical protein
MTPDERLEQQVKLHRDRVLREAELIINPPPKPSLWQRFKRGWVRYWCGV